MAQNHSRRQVHESCALGLALVPKAVRYFEKHPYGPGGHGRSRRRQESNYTAHLKGKQRLRAQYDIHGSQLRHAFEEARHITGLTGENLVELLEMCLDALVLRADFARTIQQARQFVAHRHILVDSKVIDRPSFRVKPSQTIRVRPKSQTTASFEIAAQGICRDVLPAVPGYLDVEPKRLKATLIHRPKHAGVPVTCNVQMIAGHYSR